MIPNFKSIGNRRQQCRVSCRKSSWTPEEHKRSYIIIGRSCYPSGIRELQIFFTVQVFFQRKIWEQVFILPVHEVFLCRCSNRGMCVFIPETSIDLPFSPG